MPGFELFLDEIANPTMSSIASSRWSGRPFDPEHAELARTLQQVGSSNYRGFRSWARLMGAAC